MGANVSQSSINQSSIVQNITNDITSNTTTCTNGATVAQTINMSDITFNNCNNNQITAGNTITQNVSMQCYDMVNSQQAILNSVAQALNVSGSQTTAAGLAENLANVQVTNSDNSQVTTDSVTNALTNLDLCVNQASNSQSITMGGSQPIVITCGTCPPFPWPAGYTCTSSADITAGNNINQTLVQSCVENMTNSFTVQNIVSVEAQASSAQVTTMDTVSGIVNSIGSVVSQVVDAVGGVLDTVLIFGLAIPLAIFIIMAMVLKGVLGPGASIGQIITTALWIFFIGLPFAIPGILFCSSRYSNPVTAWFLLPMGLGKLKDSPPPPQPKADESPNSVFGRKKGRKASFKKKVKKSFKMKS